MNIILPVAAAIETINTAYDTAKKIIKDSEIVIEKSVPIIDMIETKAEDLIFSIPTNIFSVLRGGDKVVDLKNIDFKREDVQSTNVDELIKALVPTYGNYVGPSYSGGQRGLKESQINYNIEPIDAIDHIARIHDYMYGYNIENIEMYADEVLLENLQELINYDNSYIYNPILLSMKHAFNLKRNIERLKYGSIDQNLKIKIINETKNDFSKRGIIYDPIYYVDASVNTSVGN